MIEVVFWQQFLLVASAHFLAVLSPGPDFIVTLRQALYQTKQHALFTSIGIASGIAVHVGAALFGIAIFLKGQPILFYLLQIIGVLYLLYLSYMCLRSKPYDSVDAKKMKNTEKNSVNLNVAAKQQTYFQAFKLGFLTNISNMKAMMFFLSLFTVVIHQSTPFTWQLSFGVWMVIATGSWFAMLSFIISNPQIRHHITRYAHWIDRATGIVLLAICMSLLFSFMSNHLF